MYLILKLAPAASANGWSCIKPICYNFTTVVSFWLSTQFCRTIYIHISMIWFNSLGCCWELKPQENPILRQKKKPTRTRKFRHCGICNLFVLPETVPAPFWEPPHLIQGHRQTMRSSSKAVLNAMQLFPWRSELSMGPWRNQGFAVLTFSHDFLNLQSCRVLWNSSIPYGAAAPHLS